MNRLLVILIGTLVILSGVIYFSKNSNKVNSLKEYRNSAFGVSLKYPNTYYLKETQIDTGYSINIYSSPPVEISQNTLDSTSGLINRVFHINFDKTQPNQSSMITYLGIPAEADKLNIGTNSWTEFKIKNHNSGTFVINEMLVLILEKNGNNYEINIDSLTLDPVQQKILNSINI